MTVRRRLYYCDHYPIPLPPGHKFPIEKYAMLRALLDRVDRIELTAEPTWALNNIIRRHERMPLKLIPA